LRAAEKLKRMFEHPRHFPRRRRHAGNRHDRMPIDFENFVGAIENHGVPGSGASIARHQDTALKLEGENGGRLRLRNSTR
jgi:hypothetical protein